MGCRLGGPFVFCFLNRREFAVVSAINSSEFGNTAYEVARPCQDSKSWLPTAALFTFRFEKPYCATQSVLFAVLLQSQRAQRHKILERPRRRSQSSCCYLLRAVQTNSVRFLSSTTLVAADELRSDLGRVAGRSRNLRYRIRRRRPVITQFDSGTRPRDFCVLQQCHDLVVNPNRLPIIMLLSQQQ